MHKAKLKQNTSTQGIKIIENTLNVKSHAEVENESSDNFQLPNLQKQAEYKDVDTSISGWDSHKATTNSFYPDEITNVITTKTIQQWETIENTLYDDGQQVTQAPILDECIQWRTQILHLRISGRNSFSLSSTYQDRSTNYDEKKNTFDVHNESATSKHTLSLRVRECSLKEKREKIRQMEIFERLYEYVVSQLFSDDERDSNLVCNELNNAMQMRITAINNNKRFTKNTKQNWFHKVISPDSKHLNRSNNLVQLHKVPVQGESVPITTQVIQKIRGEKDRSTMEDKLFRPHPGRNKLGTIFNEKIVVSPVPYALSTRQSFSTVKTTPIKFVAQTLDVPINPGSSKYITCSKSLRKDSASTQFANYQSGWHNPVSPAVWPKNIKLAPLDVSQLRSNKNRYLTSSTVTLPGGRKPLSPLSRHTMPVSIQIPHNNESEKLRYQGRNVSSGQSSALNILVIRSGNAGCSSSNRKKN